MKQLARVLLLLFAVLFVFGCAARQTMQIPEFNAMTFDKTAYTSKVDSFMVLFDASSSMTHDSLGYNKFDLAKAIAERMNATLPELSQIGGLRSFGHSSAVSDQDTQLFFGMEKYTTAGFKAGLDKITEAGGPSPLYRAIDAAVNDFDGFEGGKSAVIFITDGLDLPGDVIASAQKLKDRYGDAMCFYPILVGDAADGKALVKDLAAVGKCGAAYNAIDLLSGQGMADFVKDVFLEAKPDAPAPAPAPKPAAVKMDTDKDGVYDDMDHCPRTPMGAKVNSAGCWVLGDVLFDFDKDIIKPEAYPLLDEAARILKKNYKINIELHGHTDNIGSERYNIGLSDRRAEAVKTYLNSKGIVLSRMTTKGFGFSKPVAMNDNEWGRSQNRRVEIQPIY